MYIIILAGSITTQKDAAACTLINEIPIEVRQINGDTNVLTRKYLINWSSTS
jgi:hypothetical protein